MSSIKDKSHLMCLVRRHANMMQFFHKNAFAEVIREPWFTLHILWFAHNSLLLNLFRDVKTWKGKSRHLFFFL